jgi:hypothetical protein
MNLNRILMLIGGIITIAWFATAKGEEARVPEYTPLSSNTDCGVQYYPSSSQLAINCPLFDYPVTTASQASYSIPWGQEIVASGGGTVTLALPAAPPRGHGSVVGFSTDGKTSLTLTSAIPMQGSTRISGNSIIIHPGESGSAQFSTDSTHWNVNGVTGP